MQIVWFEYESGFAESSDNKVYMPEPIKRHAIKNTKLFEKLDSENFIFITSGSDNEMLANIVPYAN